jgi:hypothetical protein
MSPISVKTMALLADDVVAAGVHCMHWKFSSRMSDRTEMRGVSREKKRFTIASRRFFVTT